LKLLLAPNTIPLRLLLFTLFPTISLLKQFVSPPSPIPKKPLSLISFFEIILFPAFDKATPFHLLSSIMFSEIVLSWLEAINTPKYPFSLIVLLKTVL